MYELACFLPEHTGYKNAILQKFFFLQRELFHFSSLFFSLLFSPSVLRPRAYYLWRRLAWCFPDFSQPKTLEIQLHFLVLLAFKANAHITQCEVTFITYKYFYN